MKKLALILFAALFAAVSCTKNDPTPATKNPEMVDLGLSVYWASFNVGAARPEEYGKYFAWGDVFGQTWDGTKWSGKGFSSAPIYEKDDNGNLKPAFDAAHINLGGSWRMPTKEDFQALIDNCITIWVDDYNGTGVAGLVFSSKINGNSIFLPASGYGDGNVINRFNSDGNYWSSTFDQTTDAYLLDFHSDHVYTCGYSRSYGFSVRAVSDKSAPDPSVETDLSAKGTANCYVVPAAGNYKFKATVKGNGSESVGTPASAEVLWESFGTSEIPYKGDIISSVSLENGYVKFSTPSVLVNGNAVIAVKDASANILWSWHIWVCKDFYPSVSAHVYNYNSGTMMDRNLGATSTIPGDVHSIGLMYQWGRKDPFLGACLISYDDDRFQKRASSTLTWPSSVRSDESTGTIDYSVLHPTTFIMGNSNNLDWYYTGSSTTDDSRWQTLDKPKSIYDPCPAGWRIPDGGTSGTWCKASGSLQRYSYGPYDSTNKGMDFGSGNGQQANHQLGSAPVIWYPFAGYLTDVDNEAYLLYAGSNGYYWSCTPEGYYAYRFSMSIYNKLNVIPSCNSLFREDAVSVRCLAE